MNHKAKIVEAIKRMHDADNRIRELQKQIATARSQKDEAVINLKRQLRNVVGFGVPVLYKGWLYRSDGIDHLEMTECKLVPLDDLG